MKIFKIFRIESPQENILRASDDPVAAVNLSVAKQQRNFVERFEKNAASAHQTLNLTDGALQQAVNVVMELLIGHTSCK